MESHPKSHCQEVSGKHQLEKLLLFQKEMSLLLFLPRKLLPLPRETISHFKEQFLSIVKSTVIKKPIRN